MKIGWTIIVLLLAAAGLWAMFQVGWNESAPRLAVGRSPRLVSPAQLPIDDLNRITLKRHEDQLLVFERSGPIWKQVRPFEHPMDAYAVRQLAQRALDLDVMDTIAPRQLGGGLSAETLQLNPPAAEITYEWPGHSYTLQLGRRSVAGRAYARIKGEETIHVVNQALHERALEMDPREWRDRTIFVEAGIESTRIEWVNGPRRVALERDRKQWRMVEPVRTRIDAEARDQFMGAIGRAQVSGFILDQPSDSDLAKFGLTDSPVSLVIASDGGPGVSPVGTGGTGVPPVPPDQVQRLIIGARAGGGTQDFFGFVPGRPVVVRISGAVLAALFVQPQDLVALTASGVVPADVKSIVIRKTGEAELQLERDLEKWRLRAAASSAGGADVPAREVSATHVQELLDQLTRLRASGVEIVDYPRDLEVATITLHGYDGRAMDTVRVVHDAQTGQWGMENGDNVLRIYPPGLKLRLTAADFGL